ncbi:MAG TPA: SARP family transcriptional regulator, partial [Actinomycetota bacterium]|nr:SARP family transcriptional regulator [Actinomycetota bacterium]
MSLSIRLLGAPSISIDGAQPPPRGKKVWGLLAYLVLSGRPTTREQLAGLLFADADDPLGALRWNLAEVRRLLGRSEILTGDPLVLELPPDAFVDILA